MCVCVCLCVYIFICHPPPPIKVRQQENAQEAECAAGEELQAEEGEELQAAHHDWATALRSLGGLTAAGPLAPGPPLVHQLTPKLIFYQRKEGKKKSEDERTISDLLHE